MNYIVWALIGMAGYSSTPLFAKLATRDHSLSGFRVLALSVGNMFLSVWATTLATGGGHVAAWRGLRGANIGWTIAAGVSLLARYRGQLAVPGSGHGSGQRRRADIWHVHCRRRAARRLLPGQAIALDQIRPPCPRGGWRVLDRAIKPMSTCGRRPAIFLSPMMETVRCSKLLLVAFLASHERKLLDYPHLSP